MSGVQLRAHSVLVATDRREGVSLSQFRKLSDAAVIGEGHADVFRGLPQITSKGMAQRQRRIARRIRARAPFLITDLAGTKQRIGLLASSSRLEDVT